MLKIRIDVILWSIISLATYDSFLGSGHCNRLFINLIFYVFFVLLKNIRFLLRINSSLWIILIILNLLLILIHNILSISYIILRNINWYLFIWVTYMCRWYFLNYLLLWTSTCTIVLICFLYISWTIEYFIFIFIYFWRLYLYIIEFIYIYIIVFLTYFYIIYIASIIIDIINIIVVIIVNKWIYMTIIINNIFIYFLITYGY